MNVNVNRHGVHDRHDTCSEQFTLLGFLPPSGAPAPTAALPNAPGTALPFESTADSCTDCARESGLAAES